MLWVDLAVVGVVRAVFFRWTVVFLFLVFVLGVGSAWCVVGVQVAGAGACRRWDFEGWFSAGDYGGYFVDDGVSFMVFFYWCDVV